MARLNKYLGRIFNNKSAQQPNLKPALPPTGTDGARLVKNNDGTVLILNSEVENYFKVLPPLNSLQEYYQTYGDKIARWYEEGKVIIFEKLPFEYNKTLLHEVEFPKGREFQKIKTEDLLVPLPAQYSETQKHPLQQVFGDDRIKSAKLQAEITRVNKELIGFAESLFPKYKFINDNTVTWRFSPTYAEAIHLDSFADRYSEVQQIRLFMNTDYVPRIWNSSHSLDTLIKKYYKTHGHGLNLKKPQEFNKHFSKRIFGSASNACRDNMPKHIALFAPGTLWMVNSLLMPHQIFFGRRMVSGSFFAKMDSMLDPSKSFFNKITSLEPIEAKEAKKNKAA